jgi:ribosomal protein S18 acetylase RimI-like enzyme
MATAVRTARVDDADLLSSLNADVQAIHAAAMPWRFKPPGPELFSSSAVSALLAKPDNLIFIAEWNAAPAGYVYAEVVRQLETERRYAQNMIYVHHIGVRPEHRGKGIGGALLDAVRGEGAQRGVTLLALDVWTFNDTARTFFRRHGFTPYNERLWNRSPG